MAVINTNFNKVIGKIKPMHGVGQPPFLGVDYSYFKYLKEAGIPYSRLHDVGGAYGCFRYVDIPNIFRDFNADETDPESYDFSFTDSLISALIEYDCQPIYRLGVSIENFQNVKAYRIYPPEDFSKWARICEHIIRHYNEGWADGFHYNIKYWEIWNEPDISSQQAKNTMWQGTAEQYYELYTITAKHLKECFGDDIKIGGFASAQALIALVNKGIINLEKSEHKESLIKDMEIRDKFLHDFFKYIKEHNAPLDFFSWHAYAQVEGAIAMSEHYNNVLEKYGFGDVETHLNEWSNAWTQEVRGTSYASARYASMMLAMQNDKTDVLCFYDARIGISQYGGLFNPLTTEPYCAYYAFLAFGHLYKLKNQTECSCDDGEIYLISASDGENNAIMISNSSENDKKLQLSLDASYTVYLVDEEHFLQETELNPAKFTLKKDQVALVVNKVL